MISKIAMLLSFLSLVEGRQHSFYALDWRGGPFFIRNGYRAQLRHVSQRFLFLPKLLGTLMTDLGLIGYPFFAASFNSCISKIVIE